MSTVFQAYGTAIAALGYVAALLLVQVLVADVVGLSRKHVPGTPVDGDHADPLFRASRTVGNANESIAVFLCALLFCILSAASPSYTGLAAWTFAISRTVYAGFYYANLQMLRSASFGISLLALAALIAVGAFTS